MLVVAPGPQLPGPWPLPEHPHWLWPPQPTCSLGQAPPPQGSAPAQSMRGSGQEAGGSARRSQCPGQSVPSSGRISGPKWPETLGWDTSPRKSRVVRGGGVCTPPHSQLGWTERTQTPLGACWGQAAAWLEVSKDFAGRKASTRDSGMSEQGGLSDSISTRSPWPQELGETLHGILPWKHILHPQFLFCLVFSSAVFVLNLFY